MNVRGSRYIEIESLAIGDVKPPSSTIGELITIYIYIHRVIQNDCRGFNNLSYTIHLRQEYIFAPMDQEIPGMQ